MGEATPNFQVLAEIPRLDMDRAAPRYLLCSTDGNQVVLARRDGERFVPVAGPYTLEQVSQLATSVLAGEARARTGPETLNALALAVTSFAILYGRATAADPFSDAAPPAPETAPPAPGCTPHARAVPTHESGFSCTPCGG